MPVTWTKERYEEGYDDYITPFKRRFQWQAECLISDFGWTPDQDDLVVIGDKYGWLSYYLVQLGFAVVTTEVAQHIRDTWYTVDDPGTGYTRGAPGITPEPPAMTDSHSEPGWRLVRDLREQSLGRVGVRSTVNTWAITADVIGDYKDAELGMLADFNNHLRGAGKVVHMVTPDSPNVVALSDNNWKLWSGWRTALDATPGCESHDVVSLEGWLRKDPIPVQVIDTGEGLARQVTSYPYRMPSSSSFMGPWPHETDGYVFGTLAGEVGPIMTKYDGQSWAEIDPDKSPAMSQTRGLCGCENGTTLACSWLNNGTDTYHFASFDVLSGTWGSSHAIYSDPGTESLFSGIVWRATEYWVSHGYAAERVMGTFYTRSALSSSVDGTSWTLRHQLGVGEQVRLRNVTLVNGVNGALHLCYADQFVNIQYSQTLSSSDSLNARTNIGLASTSLNPGWGVLQNGVITNSYVDSNGALVVTFTSGDNPSDFKSHRLQGTPEKCGLTLLDGAAYALWDDRSASNAVWLLGDGGANDWTGTPEQVGIPFFYSCGIRDGKIGYLYGDGFDVQYDEYGDEQPPIEPPDFGALTYQEWADWQTAVDGEYQTWYGDHNASDPVTYPERRDYYDWRNEWRNYHGGKPAADPQPPLNQTPPDPYVDPSTKEEWCSYNISCFPAAIAWYDSMVQADPANYPTIRVWQDWTNEFNSWMDRGNWRPKSELLH